MEVGSPQERIEWGAFLSNPLLQPRSSPSCAELQRSVDLCRPPCCAWSAATMGQDGTDPAPP